MKLSNHKSLIEDTGGAERIHRLTRMITKGIQRCNQLFKAKSYYVL